MLSGHLRDIHDFKEQHPDDAELQQWASVASSPVPCMKQYSGLRGRCHDISCMEHYTAIHTTEDVQFQYDDEVTAFTVSLSGQNLTVTGLAPIPSIKIS